MSERRLLSKVVCQVVTATLDGDRVTGEQSGAPVACYSPQELAELWAKAEAEVAAANEINEAQQRRTRRK